MLMVVPLWTRISLIAVAAALAGPVAAVPATATTPAVVPTVVSPIAAATDAVAMRVERALALASAERQAERDRAVGRARARELRTLRHTRSVRGALRRAWLSGAIRRSTYDRWRGTWWRAQQAAGRLSGARAVQLRGALRQISRLAARRGLTSSRLALAMLTVDRNRVQFSQRPFPASGQRLRFGADPVVFIYVPGQGIHVHWLSTAGRINGFARSCLPGAAHPKACQRGRLRTGLGRLRALASRRGGFLAWESLYRYAQSRGPWISAMTQATAIQALARGARSLGDRRWLQPARSALGAFERRPPVGVSVLQGDGRRYLMYSFAPGLSILNGQLQTLTGLRDMAVLSGSARSRRLFKAGDRVLRPALERWNTGAWSLYAAGGRESNLGYHQLTAGFLGNLCRRTHRRAYCDQQAQLLAYERQAPRMKIAAVRKARAGRRSQVVFSLSKISSVVVRVRGRAGTRLLRTSQLPRGVHRVTWTPARPGRFRVEIAARGLSGPPGSSSRVVRVAARPHPKAKKKRGARRRP